MIGNDCLLGQISSFIETLHLSYDEILYKIPYRNLVIMQKDKLYTVCGGTKVQRASGKDVMKRKRGG